MWTSVFIIHRPYFQYPDTQFFWTQDQVYEWFTTPHPTIIDNEIQSTLHNYLHQLNHQTPPHKDIFHTSLRPQHDLIIIPTPSARSKPPIHRHLYQRRKVRLHWLPLPRFSRPLGRISSFQSTLHQFPQPTMDEPKPSTPGPSTQPLKKAPRASKVDKATQTSPKHHPRDNNCPYPPCRSPSCKHPKLSKTFFQKRHHSGDTNPDATESSSEDDYMNLYSP